MKTIVVPLHPQKTTDYNGPKVHIDIAKTLSRSLRIQTTIIVLDGMLRKDAQYEFTGKQLELFSSIGKLIREMLPIPLQLELSDGAARQLFDKLEDVRHGIMIESLRVADSMKTTLNFQNDHLVIDVLYSRIIIQILVRHYFVFSIIPKNSVIELLFY